MTAFQWYFKPILLILLLHFFFYYSGNQNVFINVSIFISFSSHFSGRQGIVYSRCWSIGGSLWTITQKTHFPKEFLAKFGTYHDYSKILLLEKEKLKKILFSLQNRGETLISMSHYFDKTMTILTSHFLRFGALKLHGANFFFQACHKMRGGKHVKFALTHENWFLIPQGLPLIT